MAIMAMATARRVNSFHLANVLVFLSYFSISLSPIAGEWQFDPSVGVEETYTNNIDLTITDPTSTFVTKAIIDFGVKYQSRLTDFSFSGVNTRLFFSHDSDLNDNYLVLNADGQYNIWAGGPAVFATANVRNVNRNSANNGLADLISGDTVQAENYSTGLLYNITNSSYSIKSSLSFDMNRYEDGLGEYDGFSTTLNAKNGNNARITFWEFDGDFSTRSQDFSGETRTGDQYKVSAKLGLITSFDINPFIRFYDEDFSGDFGNQSQQTTASWGPGLRWLVSPHLTLDVTYNYVSDNTISDDYISALIQWEPSARTSLSASYSKRFFGNSYNIRLQHRTKRLTNTVTYDETLEVFDRNNFEQVGLGSNLEPVESSEFSLYRRLRWTSALQLARTTFTINTYATRREELENDVIDDTLGVSFAINRKISRKSNLSLLAKYDSLIFDKNNPLGSGQEDKYTTISTTYSKDIAASLSTQFTLQNVDRNSDVDQFSYNEFRAIINVTKEF